MMWRMISVAATVALLTATASICAQAQTKNYNSSRSNKSQIADGAGGVGGGTVYAPEYVSDGGDGTAMNKGDLINKNAALGAITTGNDSPVTVSTEYTSSDQYSTTQTSNDKIGTFDLSIESAELVSSNALSTVSTGNTLAMKKGGRTSQSDSILIKEEGTKGANSGDSFEITDSGPSIALGDPISDIDVRTGVITGSVEAYGGINTLQQNTGINSVLQAGNSLAAKPLPSSVP